MPRREPQSIRNGDAVNLTPLLLSKEGKAWIRWAYKRSRTAAADRGIPFALSFEDFHRAFEWSDGLCEVTNIPFDLACLRGEPSTRSPWSPTIDRIDSSVGYVAGNCRFVCRIVNYAMNEWGESTLWELVDRSIAARGKRPERLKIETQSRSACYTHGVK